MASDLPDETRLDAQIAPAEARTWVETLLTQPLNRALSKIRGLLNAGLTLSTNLDCQVLSKTFTAAAPWTTLEFQSSLKGPCDGVELRQVVTLDSGGKPSGAVPTGPLSVPHWDERNNRDGTRTIRILDQQGLTTGTRYTVTWRAFGG